MTDQIITDILATTFKLIKYKTIHRPNSEPVDMYYFELPDKTLISIGVPIDKRGRDWAQFIVQCLSAGQNTIRTLVIKNLRDFRP